MSKVTHNTIIRMTRTVALVMLLTALIASQCFAASGYGYTLRIFAGNEGVLQAAVTDPAKAGETDGTQPADAFADPNLTRTVKDIPAGTPLTIDLDDLNVQVTNEDYYAKGLRPSGHDDGDNTIVRSVTISNMTEDLSYVVVYGIKSSMVKYTVKYEDRDGNELLPPSEYYGSVGDKPIVTFKYIKGYAPTAYNETKTLTEDEDSNVFVFKYYKSTVPTPAPAVNQTNPKTPANTANRANPAAGTNAAGTADQQAAQAGAVNNAAEGTPELVDLDDQDVPLAAPDASLDAEGKSGSTGALWIALLVTGLVLAACIVFILLKRRRNALAASAAGIKAVEEPAEKNIEN